MTRKTGSGSGRNIGTEEKNKTMNKRKRKSARNLQLGSKTNDVDRDIEYLLLSNGNKMQLI